MSFLCRLFAVLGLVFTLGCVAQNIPTKSEVPFNQTKDSQGVKMLSTQCQDSDDGEDSEKKKDDLKFKKKEPPFGYAANPDEIVLPENHGKKVHKNDPRSLLVTILEPLDGGYAPVASESGEAR